MGTNPCGNHNPRTRSGNVGFEESTAGAVQRISTRSKKVALFLTPRTLSSLLATTCPLRQSSYNSTLPDPPCQSLSLHDHHVSTTTRLLTPFRSCRSVQRHAILTGYR